MEYESLNLVKEMITHCNVMVSDKEVVIKGIRAICKWYGGQQFYLPCRDKESKNSKELRGVLSDAVGCHNGEIMLSTIMSFFGGVQVYIPKEARAFRNEIAKEILEAYDGKAETMRDLCRTYDLSFVQVYRLWHMAQDNKKQLNFNFYNSS